MKELEKSFSEEVAKAIKDVVIAQDTLQDEGLKVTDWSFNPNGSFEVEVEAEECYKEWFSTTGLYKEEG